VIEEAAEEPFAVQIPGIEQPKRNDRQRRHKEPGGPRFAFKKNLQRGGESNGPAFELK